MSLENLDQNTIRSNKPGLLGKSAIALASGAAFGAIFYGENIIAGTSELIDQRGFTAAGVVSGIIFAVSMMRDDSKPSSTESSL